ncbi:peptidase family C50-domain-containing protein [Daedaleopsis nitida]|nr:peptidase family C50-domain-containing protein [Daedaleopsis nitida]
MPPLKARQPVGRTTKATSSSRSKTASTSPDELADKLATKLTISDSKGKAKALELTPDERRANAMRAVNAASKALSNILDSGWKASEAKSTDRTTVASVTKHAAAARKYLDTLRHSSPGEVDVERAASSIVGKLSGLEMYNAALGLLQDMYTPLVALYHPDPPAPSGSSLLQLLALPLHDGTISELHLNLISTYLLHSILVITHTASDIPALAAALYDHDSPTLLTWSQVLTRLPEKQQDHIYTRTYTVTSRLASTSTQPASAYTLRVYSLLCLAHTRPSIVKPNTFWEQAVKFTAVFANSDFAAPREGAKSVCEAFTRLIACAESRLDRAEFLAGTAFARFCEYWSRFAKQASDLQTLEHIGRLNQRCDGDVHPPEERAVIETSTICTALAHALTVFEQWSEYAGDFASKLQEAAGVIRRCGPSLVQSGSDHDRVKRGLERLRRATTKIIESSQSSDVTVPSEVKACAMTILERIVDILCETITQHDTSTSSIVSPALEGLFTLSRTSFVFKNPDTYTTADAHLTRAAKLVSSISTSSQHPSASSANYTRCIASVYHNFAAQLHQNGRYDHTVRFLDQGCRLGQRALEMHRAAKTRADSMDLDDQTKGKEDAWKTLEDQLYRRWELLGVCHAKTGDRKLAHQAFLDSVRAFPFTQQSFVELARTTPPSLLFDGTPALRQLGALLDRVTYIGACELFQTPSNVSALSWFPAVGEELDQSGKCIVGVLLERQIASLEESRWKQGVKQVLEALIDDALLVYDPEERPLRYVRVLLKKMEAAYHTEQGEIKGASDEVQALLSRQNYGLDTPLAKFCPEFLATLHLWLAVHAHRTRDPTHSATIIAHAEEACKTVRAMVPVTAPRLSYGLGRPPKDRLEAAEPARRTTRSAKAAPKARTATTRAKAPPVTPKKRRALDPVSLNTAAAPATSPKTSSGTGAQGKMEFDDFAKLIQLIHMVSHLIGLVGHVLVRVQLLNAARRLTERHLGVTSEVYVSLTIDTAHEYVKLGRAEKAVSVLAHVLPGIRSGSLSQEVAITFLLRYSEALAATGEVLKASMAYCDAVAVASDLVSEEKGLPTNRRIRVRAALLERAAQAALSYAAIQDARDDPTSSIEGLLQSLRLWNRAIDTISRLQPASPTPPADDNPFEAPPTQAADSRAAIQETRVLSPRASRSQVLLDSAGWRLAEGLLSTLLSLSQAYAARGSAREAEFFAQQTKDLAQALHAPVMISRALAQQGELQIQLGQLQDGHASLVAAAELVMHLKGPDAAEVRRLLGRYSQLSADSKGAKDLFDEAAGLLDELGSVFASLEGGNAGRKSLGMSPRSLNTQMSESVLAPTLLARVLRHQISLLHEVGEEYSSLLERFAKLPQNADAKAEETALRAKLTLDEVYSRFRADMFLSSLAESAMTIPMGMSGEIVPTSASQDMLETLATAEKLFWEHMGYIARRGHVSSVREAAVCLALIRTFRTSLGRGDKFTPVLAAQLLDASTVTTLRREMLEVIRHKFLNMNATDDLQWPLITPNGSPLPPSLRPKPVTRYSNSLLSDDEEPMDDVDLKSYWDAVKKRYESQCFDTQKMSVSQADSLPPHWTVVNVSVTEDRHTMFVTRQRAGKKPLIFCLPLKGRREGQEDEHLTYEDAIRELQEIIRLSDEGTRQAADVKKEDKAARVAWWKARTELDTRLRELLADIEFCWLGAFKTIFTPSQDLPADDLAALRARLDSVFQGSLVFQDKKPKLRVGLDEGLLECFSTLSPSCRDEELEDLVYFVLDLYQFHGIPVAISEVDMDQVVVELRNALEEHAGRVKSRVPQDDDSHIFLVLDKNVQGIPWESVPVLRGQSVSRIPSMDFLLDRLEFAHWRKWEDGRPQEGLVDQAAVDPRKTYYVLNPSGDLKGTEGRFADWLKGMKGVGWDGVVGRAPSEQQLLDALTNRDLVIYFGHGGAEQYVRSHKIRHLPRCAATMLWGCSSGALKYMGEFDRTGTPYHYMVAGCPTLVANLWDVTDRDTDKFSQSVFDDLRLTAEEVKRWRPDADSSERMSVVKAVARARETVKLKYLTGAAPVVYGIPFYL